jgi:hypothetical protein
MHLRFFARWQYRAVGIQGVHVPAVFSCKCRRSSSSVHHTMCRVTYGLWQHVWQFKWAHLPQSEMSAYGTDEVWM